MVYTGACCASPSSCATEECSNRRYARSLSTFPSHPFRNIAPLHSTDRPLLPLPTIPKPKQSVNWYVLRQDSFRQKDGRHLARLDEYSGKTVKRAFPLEGARVLPLAQPTAAFQITLASGRRITLQPESGTRQRAMATIFIFLPAQPATSHGRGLPRPPHNTEGPADCVEWVSALQMAITMPNVRLASLTNFSEAAKRSTTMQRPSTVGDLDKVGQEACHSQGQGQSVLT